MTSRSGKSTVRNMAVAACFLIAATQVVATQAIAAETPSFRAAIEGRSADYQRQAPGVPVWPSTCDCISLGFGFKDALGVRPLEFNVGDASGYYTLEANARQEVRAKLAAKGPRKELVSE